MGNLSASAPIPTVPVLRRDRNLAFTADGKYIATANADTTLYLLENP